MVPNAITNFKHFALIVKEAKNFFISLHLICCASDGENKLKLCYTVLCVQLVHVKDLIKLQTGIRQKLIIIL